MGNDFGWNSEDLRRNARDYRNAEPGTSGDGGDPEADG